MASITVSSHQPLSTKHKRIFGIVGLVLLFVSPLLFLGAGSLYRGACEKVETWTRTEATVIAMLPEHGDDGTVYYPLFRFTAADGQSYDVKSNFGSGDPLYKLNERIPVLYPETAPKEAVVESFGSLYFAPLALAIFGLFDFVFGCLATYVARRKEPEVTPEEPQV